MDLTLCASILLVFCPSSFASAQCLHVLRNLLLLIQKIHSWNQKMAESTSVTPLRRLPFVSQDAHDKRFLSTKWGLWGVELPASESCLPKGHCQCTGNHRAASRDDFRYWLPGCIWGRKDAPNVNHLILNNNKKSIFLNDSSCFLFSQIIIIP